MKIAEIYADKSRFVSGVTAMLEVLGAGEQAALAIDTSKGREHALLATTMGLLQCQLGELKVQCSLTPWRKAARPTLVELEVERPREGPEWSEPQWSFDLNLEGVPDDASTLSGYADFVRAYLRFSGYGIPLPGEQ